MHFNEPVCITGLKVGAPPGGMAGKDDSVRPHVRVLARELTALPASRFACLCEPCPLPKSGTQAVRFEVSMELKQKL